jgi:hypothetical protein
MLKKFILLLIIVCGVSSYTTFINNKQRPELFELTDNEVAVFRVTIPQNEFSQLKQRVNTGHVFNNRISIIDDLFRQVKGFVQFLSQFPYSEVYPGYNFTEILPELKINEEGFSTISVDEVMEKLNITRKGLSNIDLSNEYKSYGNYYFVIKDIVYKRNSEFNLTRITETLNKLSSNDKNKRSNIDTTSDDEIFKTKNGTLVVELNNEQKFFQKLTFSVGGQSGLRFGKIGFNFKIRGKDELYGRTQFRLRPDAREATFLRSKLVCDIQNRLGIPSISANYATLYINDEYMGFYVLMDTFKLSWIEYEYGDKDTRFLYQCKETGNYLTETSSYNCINKNEEVLDHTEWNELLTSIKNAETASDIEEIFDVDLFVTQIALEYLLGSWDHFLNYGHNYYLYKPVNDKWKYLTYDFDGEFGQDIEMVYVGAIIDDVPEIMDTVNMDYPNYSFEQWTRKNHLIEILILNDKSRFNEILKNVVNEVFNPSILYPRIDELKTFIKPFVKLDKIKNDDGKYPGRLNEIIGDYTFDQWDANSEFTNIETTSLYRAYGLKYWILEKYRYVCKLLDMECDSKYINENFQYSVNEELSFSGFGVSSKKNTDNNTDDPIPTSTKSSDHTEVDSKTKETPKTITYKCIAETLGYHCCSSDNTTVYAHDSNGDWGFDFEKKEWCGITPYSEQLNENSCWSEILGYLCCSECIKVVEVDSNGKWGIENNHWCGIPTFCD